MDRKLGSLLTIFFLACGVFISVMIFNKPLSQLIRASAEITPSSTNSLIFAWPLDLPADGQKQSTVTVFLRNEKNYPVSNKPVSITSTLGTVLESQLNSGKDGKVEFHLVSKSPGIAEITAFTGTQQLSQKISVKFE